MLKSGAAFWRFRTGAITMRSNSRLAVSTISRCPLWNGSKVPGNRAVLTVRVSSTLVMPYLSPVLLAALSTLRAVYSSCRLVVVLSK